MRTTEQLAGGVEFSPSVGVMNSEGEIPYNNLNIGSKKVLANSHLDMRQSINAQIKDGDLNQQLASSVVDPSSPPDLRATLRQDSGYISESKIFSKSSPLQEVWSPSGTRQVSSRKGATYFTSVKLQFLSKQGFDFGITPTASNGSWKKESLFQEQLNPELNEVPSPSREANSETDTFGFKPSGDWFLTGDSASATNGHRRLSDIIPKARRCNEESAENLLQNEGAWLKVGRMTSHVASIRLEFNDEHAELIGESPGSIEEMKASRLRKLLQPVEDFQKGSVNMDSSSNSGIDSDSDVTEVTGADVTEVTEETVKVSENMTEAAQTDSESGVSMVSESGSDVSEVNDALQTEEVPMDMPTEEVGAIGMSSEFSDDNSNDTLGSGVITIIGVNEQGTFDRSLTDGGISLLISEPHIEDVNGLNTDGNGSDSNTSDFTAEVETGEGNDSDGTWTDSGDIQVTGEAQAEMVSEIVVESVQMISESGVSIVDGSGSDITEVTGAVPAEEPVMVSKIVVESVQMISESGVSMNSSSGSDVAEVTGAVPAEEPVMVSENMMEAVQMISESGVSMSSNSGSDVAEVTGAVPAEETVMVSENMMEEVQMISESDFGVVISSNGGGESGSDVTEVTGAVSAEETVMLSETVMEAVQMISEGGVSMSSNSGSDVTEVAGAVSAEETVMVSENMTEAVQMISESGVSMNSNSGSDVTEVTGAVSVEEAVMVNENVTEAIQMDIRSDVDMDSDSDIPPLTTLSKEEVKVISGASKSFHFSTYEQQLESLLSPELIALTSTMSNWDISEVSSGGSYTLTEYQDMKAVNVLSFHTKQMDTKRDVDMDSDSDIPPLTTLSKEEVKVIQDISGASKSFHFSTYEQQLESLLSPELITLTSTMSNWDISEVSSGGSYTLTEYQDMKAVNVLSLHTDRTRVANDESACQSTLKTHYLGQDSFTEGHRSELIHFKGTVIEAKKEGILAVDPTAGHGRGEHAALLVLLVSTSCFIGYIFCTLARRTVTSVRQWHRQRINLRISDLEFRAVQLMVDGEYGKAINALNAGLKYVVSVDGKQLHINSAGFKHLLGKALLGQEDYSAAEKTIRSLVSYYEGIATDDLHLAKLLEDLAISLLYQGRREQEEAYGYLTRSLKIYETEMMLALRALGTQEGSFYGVNYHAQVYSARLIEDAIAGADVSCAIEADATSLPDCPEVFASCESKEEVELGECERAVAELDALLAAPVAIEVFSAKIPHSSDSISRQIDVSRVRYEMGLVLELSERYEDAMMVIEEAHEVLAELTADISGVTEFAGEVSHIASLSLVMLKKIVFLERFLVVRDDSHGLISNGDRTQTGKVLETPPKRVRSTDKSYRESPDTVIF